MACGKKISRKYNNLEILAYFIGISHAYYVEVLGIMRHKSGKHCSSSAVAVKGEGIREQMKSQLLIAFGFLAKADIKDYN